METRIALIGIIVENPESIEALNHLLHEYGKYIIGRMGIPYREREVNIISVAIDAPQDVINALSGKIGRLDGIGAKTVYSNIKGKNEKENQTIGSMRNYALWHDCRGNCKAGRGYGKTNDQGNKGNERCAEDSVG